MRILVLIRVDAGPNCRVEAGEMKGPTLIWVGEFGPK